MTKQQATASSVTGPYPICCHCPDCADGGAEWVELGFENKVKRVTFEYMKEPEELKTLIPSLRELMAGFNDCRSEE